MKNKGLCVFTACGHTGVINAANYAKKLTGLDNIHMIMGGFHLAPPGVNDRINPTITDLLTLDLDYIITGHCTGARAQYELTVNFAERHIPYGVGTVFNFEC